MRGSLPHHPDTSRISYGLTGPGKAPPAAARVDGVPPPDGDGEPLYDGEPFHTTSDRGEGVAPHLGAGPV